ncbi:MAG: glycosyltransferase [Candidatus Latescibacteria bacterium]|nr:glycosyltransferase [bacterium]MBD3423257.1 glycosyltransferase [Candidatus Latescibacterota bacterium]
MKTKSMKADLHVHSRYSTRPSQWFLRKVGASESYTDPMRLYAIAKGWGMDLVTITDHNTLAGSLEIAHLKNTFLSEEVTTYFPEDGCKLHVLVYDINEAQHEDISRIRESVFDLVEYLNREGIVHGIAHPMFSINDRLTLEHLEKMLLLFKNFELNGSRDEYQNNMIEEILGGLAPRDIEDISNRHDMEPYGSRPWEKNIIGGSDDHSSLNIARVYTEVKGAASKDEFLEGIGLGNTRVKGKNSTPKTLAHNLYSIAYQFYKNRLDLDRYSDVALFLRFADRTLLPPPEGGKGLVERLRNMIGNRRSSDKKKSKPDNIQALIRREAREIISENPRFSDMLDKTEFEPWDMEEVWFEFVNKISEKCLRHSADSILDNLPGANMFNIFHTVGSVGSLYLMLAPYFISHAVFIKDRRFSTECRDHFIKRKKTECSPELKIAHFTDTYHDVNGVALTLQMQARMALKNNKQQTIITCGPDPESPRVTNFEPIGCYQMPEYPDMKLFYPPLVKMLDYCYRENFTHIHSATPGPVGLAALAISRILRIPIFGTYHTALPQYVNRLTDDESVEGLMWKYISWYYNQMGMVYVPSRATGEELTENGIPEEKIRFYHRGIDVQRFHPSNRNGFFSNRFGVEDSDIKLLYVGRVSREKNMPLLAETFRKLTSLRDGVQLVIVGDGPYLEEMKESLSGLPVTFTGFLDGEELAQAYASSDIFIFPSTTDTFGKVVLEAQASGLPVIVSDRGGPRENLIDQRTGFIVTSEDREAYLKATLKLIDNPDLLRRMRKTAREYTENRSFESAYLKLWDSYGTVTV